ncbi:hypothetical protein SLT36_05425 [Aminobacter sp. BA135]|uniref:hypothetical protein n=1 Tax=Aminobacter sp. BA135 TaxID=537596 RepID=UPI003D7A4856
MTNGVRAGVVDWTGDNPFVYLKTDPSGDWSSLSLFFRVVCSDKGRGNVILVLEDPYDAGREGVRVCFTDNEPLARDLIERFVKRFGLFRPAHAALAKVEMLADASFGVRHDYPGLVTEHAETPDGRNASLTWCGLQAAFVADVPADQTQTGEHAMLSIFQPATSAEVIVDGKALPGVTVERDFFGGRAQSAALAHSETWIRAA